MVPLPSTPPLPPLTTAPTPPPMARPLMAARLRPLPMGRAPRALSVAPRPSRHQRHQAELTPVFLATHGFARCGAAECSQPIQSLAFKSTNSTARSSYYDHLHRDKSDDAHTAYVLAHGGAPHIV